MRFYSGTPEAAWLQRSDGAYTGRAKGTTANFPPSLTPMNTTTISDMIGALRPGQTRTLTPENQATAQAIVEALTADVGVHPRNAQLPQPDVGCAVQLRRHGDFPQDRDLAWQVTFILSHGLSQRPGRLRPNCRGQDDVRFNCGSRIGAARFAWASNGDHVTYQHGPLLVTNTSGRSWQVELIEAGHLCLHRDECELCDAWAAWHGIAPPHPVT